MPYVKKLKQEPKLELLDKYKTFHLAHQYDTVAKEWLFVGYTCTQCHRTVQNPNIVPKHFDNCVYKGPTIYLQEPEPWQILNKKGEVWDPKYVNVHETTKHSLKE